MTDVTAILSLLDDPDPVVQQSLAARLGSDRVLLDRAWQAARARGGEPPANLTALVLAADAEELIDAFGAAEDLESGCWVLPRLLAPRTDWRRPGAAALDALAARLRGAGDGGAVARFLCEECGFSGDNQHYQDPENGYLPCLLERRLGLPITLTALWLLVGRRLGLALDAIAAPGHVVGRWHGVDGPHVVDLFAGEEISLATLERRVRDAGEPSVAPYLAPASDRALLRRMARNLVASYTAQGDRLRATIAHGLASA